MNKEHGTLRQMDKQRVGLGKLPANRYNHFYDQPSARNKAS
jgi:hypothetical protein